MNASPARHHEETRTSDFQITRRVEFCDTDMAGIMHFSNFFRFMEAAETAFLRSLGLSVLLSRCGLEVCLPRVHAECDYLAPLHFEDEVLIHLLVERKGARSLTYQFRFYRLGSPDRRQVARGRLVLACATRQGNGILKSVPLPGALAGKIQPAPPQLLAAGLISSRVGSVGANSGSPGGAANPTASTTATPRRLRGTNHSIVLPLL
ncbi:MAG TPA: thioesterase family protein [Verrucomicrobiae bacterium]